MEVDTFLENLTALYSIIMTSSTTLISIVSLTVCNGTGREQASRTLDELTMFSRTSSEKTHNARLNLVREISILDKTSDLSTAGMSCKEASGSASALMSRGTSTTTSVYSNLTDDMTTPDEEYQLLKSNRIRVHDKTNTHNSSNKRSSTSDSAAYIASAARGLLQCNTSLPTVFQEFSDLRHAGDTKRSDLAHYFDQVAQRVLSSSGPLSSSTTARDQEQQPPPATSVLHIVDSESSQPPRAPLSPLENRHISIGGNHRATVSQQQRAPSRRPPAPIRTRTNNSSSLAPSDEGNGLNSLSSSKRPDPPESASLGGVSTFFTLSEEREELERMLKELATETTSHSTDSGEHGGLDAATKRKMDRSPIQHGHEVVLPSEHKAKMEKADTCLEPNIVGEDPPTEIHRKGEGNEIINNNRSPRRRARASSSRLSVSVRRPDPSPRMETLVEENEDEDEEDETIHSLNVSSVLRLIGPTASRDDNMSNITWSTYHITQPVAPPVSRTQAVPPQHGVHTNEVDTGVEAHLEEEDRVIPPPPHLQQNDKTGEVEVSMSNTSDERKKEKGVPTDICVDEEEDDQVTRLTMSPQAGWHTQQFQEKHLEAEMKDEEALRVALEQVVMQDDYRQSASGGHQQPCTTKKKRRVRVVAKFQRWWNRQKQE